MRPQEGSGSPAKGSNKKYVFPANDRKLEAITLESDDKGDAVTLVARFDGVEQKIVCGHGALAEGAAGVWPVTRATGGGQRRMDRGRHVHGQDLLLRDAVHRHGQT